MAEPRMSEIKSGWAAHGDGWTVHGATREDAIRLFREREEKYREIDARSYASEGRVTTKLQDEERLDKAA